MQKLATHKFFPVLLLLPALMLWGGCKRTSSVDNALAALNDSNIKRLSSIYAQFQVVRNWTGPKSAEELKQFVTEQGRERMQRVGVNLDRLDELLVSERDKQPFAIRWGLVSQARGPSVPVIFESGGVEGKFQVAFTGGEVIEVERAEYDEMFAGRRDPGGQSTPSPTEQPGRPTDTRPGGEPTNIQ